MKLHIALKGNTLKYTEELMTCNWVLTAYKATFYQLEKAKGFLLSGQISKCDPFGANVASWTQS